MIRIQQINKRFHKGEPAEVVALDNISLEITPGEFTVLIGVNGSGKSTFLNAIAGTMPADSGNIFIGDAEVSSTPEYERSRWVSRIFQNPQAGTAPGLSVLENFRMAALRSSKKTLKTGINKEFRELVKKKIATLKLGLENNPDRLMGTLSGGQRQALTLLMAVMAETKVLLMDEPASALDPKTADLIMQLANDIIRKNMLTTLFVTHNLKDAIQYGDRLIQFSEGKIVRDIRGHEKKNIKISDLYNWF